MGKNRSLINKYYIKNSYYLNYKVLVNYFPLFFTNINNFFIKSKTINILFNHVNIIKKSDNLKKLFTKKIYRYLKFKFLFNKNLNFKRFSYKIFKFLSKQQNLNELKFLPDSLPFLKSLKTNKLQNLKIDNLINHYGYIYLKSSGINTFVTLTNVKGEVLQHILQEFLKMLNVLKKNVQFILFVS